MSKQNYEIPLCESVKLEFDGAVLSDSGSDKLGKPGLPGNDLDILDPLTF